MHSGRIHLKSEGQCNHIKHLTVPFSIKYCAALQRAARELKYHQMVKNQNILLSYAVTYCQKGLCYDHSQLESDEKISKQGRFRGIWPHQSCAWKYLSVPLLSCAVTPLLMQLANGYAWWHPAEETTDWWARFAIFK